MRPEEYLGLQWKDVELGKGTLTVQRTLVWRRRGGGWYYGEPKTQRSRRRIPIPFSLTRALIEHKKAQAEERLKAGPAYQDNNLVFATTEGGPLMVQNLFRRHFKPSLKKANLPTSIRLYDLRHSCATLLLAAQENPRW
jgi:integrase